MKKIVAMIALLVATAGLSACGTGDGSYDANKPVYSDAGTAGGQTSGGIASAEPVFEAKAAK